ncbi:MAG TPA: caspase family protein [Chryseosolibacter sp.]
MKDFVKNVGAFFLVSISIAAFAQKDKDFQAYEEGLAKFKAGDYSSVVSGFSAIIENPSHNKKLDEDLYFYRGQANFHVGEYKDALNDLDQALTLNHYNKAVIHWVMAKSFEKLDRNKEAESYYKDAVSLAGANKKVNAQILADRAQFFAKLGRTQEAQDDVAKAKTLDPANAAIASLSVGETKSTPANRTAGEDKSTKVIVQNNKKTEAPSSKNDQPAGEKSEAVQSVVPAIAATYKDEKRYALVIGNSNYSREIGILKNPVNDATDVATELRNSDFEVQLLTNATYVQIREAMRKFQEKLTNGPRDQTVGLFYYAGHGVQYQDENYLVPVDANVQFEDDITRMCFPVQRMVLANMERTNSRMNIVILDACRNNPFPATSRSVGSGLAEMKRARGSFIAFATAPGSVASDGNGRNGLYTQELLKALRKPGLTIEQVFKEVRMNVLRLSGDRQYTWDSSNIIGEFVFKPQ